MSSQLDSASAQTLTPDSLLVDNHFSGHSENSDTDSSYKDSGATNKKRHKHCGHHAQFVKPQQEDDLEAHDSKILVEPAGDDLLNVRLGFLQVMHVYDVQFSVPDSLGQDVTFDPLENMNAKLQSVTPSAAGQGHDISLTFSAIKEKIMQESVTLRSQSDPSRSLVLHLHARVLGKGKGTPSLKKGIHFLRIEWDEDTDASDWQGF